MQFWYNVRRDWFSGDTQRGTSIWEKTEETRSAHRVLFGKRELRRTLGGTRRRYEDNIKVYPREVVCGLDATGSDKGPT
jgi:hypothetical protein